MFYCLSLSKFKWNNGPVRFNSHQLVYLFGVIYCCFNFIKTKKITKKSLFCQANPRRNSKMIIVRVIPTKYKYNDH